MEIIEESQASKADLTVTSYTITNLVNNYIYGKMMVGQAKIRNNKSEEYKGRVKLQIWTQYNGQGSAWSGSTHTYDVDIMGGKIATIDFQFDVSLAVADEIATSAELHAFASVGRATRVHQRKVTFARDSHAECAVAKHLNSDKLSIRTADLVAIDGVVNLPNLLDVQFARQHYHVRKLGVEA